MVIKRIIIIRSKINHMVKGIGTEGGRVEAEEGEMMNGGIGMEVEAGVGMCIRKDTMQDVVEKAVVEGT